LDPIYWVVKEIKPKNMYKYKDYKFGKNDLHMNI